MTLPIFADKFFLGFVVSGADFRDFSMTDASDIFRGRTDQMVDLRQPQLGADAPGSSSRTLLTHARRELQMIIGGACFNMV